MTNSTGIPTTDDPAVANSTGPAWDLVPFDVACARCGHDLRGLTDPICPACKLEFDWSVAVPIEHLECDQCGYALMGLTNCRCPECGTEFTWKNAIAAFRRSRQDLFEFRWRRNPVRSFLRTWLRSLRPKKFWSNLNMNDSPNVWPLVAMTVVFVLLFAVTLAACIGLDLWIWTHGHGLWHRCARGQWTISPILTLPEFILFAYQDPIFSLVLSSVTLFVLLFPVALLLFRRSMRIFRVRTTHILRISTYCLSPLLILAVIAVFTPSWYAGVMGHRSSQAVELPIVGIVLAHVAWSIRSAYRNYLFIPHAGAMAVGTVSIVLLGTMTVCNAIQGEGFFSGLLHQILDWFGL